MVRLPDSGTAEKGQRYKTSEAILPEVIGERERFSSSRSSGTRARISVAWYLQPFAWFGHGELGGPNELHVEMSARDIDMGVLQGPSLLQRASGTVPSEVLFDITRSR